jgi:hypothetical protein
MTASIDTCSGRRSKRRRAGRPIDLRHSEALLTSACVMLRDEPSDVISTMTLSLPFDDNDAINDLEDLTRRLADQHGLLAETAVSGLHLKVRLLRAAEAPTTAFLELRLTED